MSYKIEVYGALCATSLFEVNGIIADESDFGSQYDDDLENAEPYCCGNRVFEPIDPKDGILKKYGIDELEYWSIANKLAEKLSFGSCGLCS